MPTVQAKSTNGSVRVDRRQLLAALRRCQAVIPNRSVKPILTGVLLESKNQGMRVAACDGEISLTQTVVAEGALPATVVPCVELVRRIRSCQDERCQFSTRQRPSHLIINRRASAPGSRNDRH